MENKDREKFKKQVISMIKKGDSYAEIARVLKCERYTVANTVAALKANGINVIRPNKVAAKKKNPVPQTKVIASGKLKKDPGVADTAKRLQKLNEEAIKVLEKLEILSDILKRIKR